MALFDFLKSGREPTPEETAKAIKSAPDASARIELLRSTRDPGALKILLDPDSSDSLAPDDRSLIADFLAAECLLKNFLTTYPQETASLEAIRQTTDEQVLGELLSSCGDLPQSLRNAILKQMKDPAVIAQSLGRIKAVKLAGRMAAEIRPEMVEKMLETADEKLIPLLIKRVSKESRLKELAQNSSPAVKRAALARINDREFLKKMGKTSDESGIKKAVAARLEASRPVYYEYRAHMDCPDCLDRVILNGPLRKIKCESCFSAISIDAEFWKNLFRVSPTGGVWIMGQRVGPVPGQRKTPHCPDCGTALETDEIDTGTDSVLACPSCGRQHLTYPAPSWLKKMVKEGKSPEQVFCAEKEDGPEMSAGEKPQPIAFSCISCGGNLELNMDTPRIVVCSYCSTQQFLPGPLWHTLHPAKKIRPWYIRYA